ncbi:putative oligopeptide transport ATP-binding protein OppD [Bordetella pertussis STO1-CHOC-0017]|nr:putative oligopeptide transport ATP-binding protein OppD [Bordetella pertussis STO1-CHOC-0017]
MKDILLDVRGLRTAFHTEAGAWPAVDGVDLVVRRGEIVGLVGESGSGKSVTGFSLLGLIDPPGEVVEGEIRFKGKDLRKLGEEQMRQLRGNRIAMIFQDPLMTLNPVLRIGEQMAEAILTHENVPRAQAMERCREALETVGIPSPDKRLRSFPHEFSGGMRQRVAIAIAMLNKPDLIICDEPTTALDVTIQGQILYRMQEICRQHDTALIWITHDLGVVAELADRVAVMYAGRIVESGPVDAVLDAPRHPYTRGLLESMPAQTQPGARLRQIDGMAPTLSARRGEVLGLVGESGCGKSTLGRVVAGLHRESAGELLYQGPPGGATARRRPACLRPGRANDLPGSAGLAQPAPAPAPDPGRSAQGAQAGAAGRDPGAGGPRAGGGGPGPRIPRALLAPDLGRPAPAHRHRPRPDGRTPVPRMRRTGGGAGCLHPGAGHQSVHGPARTARPDVPVHQPRPGRGAPYFGPGRYHVPGQDRRTGQLGRDLRPSEPPLYAGADGRSARRRPARPGLHADPRGDPVAAGPAAGLYVPPALPACHAALPRTGAGAA